MSSSLFLVGKLADRQEDAFSPSAGSPGSSLIYLLDLLSHLEDSFLTPVPPFPFFQLLHQPQALESIWLLLTVPLSPVLVLGL